jgi:hypothetical protein
VRQHITPNTSPTPPLKQKQSKKGILYAGSLWLSNSAYLYLSVSFIQMTKSLMPGLVFACGCAVGTERFRPNVALNMLLIAAGVAVCAMGEVNLVLKGFLQQLVALAFEATRLTLVQVLMTGRGVSLNPMQSLYYVSPACLVSLAVPFGARLDGLWFGWPFGGQRGSVS